jgi:hypothetical protein
MREAATRNGPRRVLRAGVLRAVAHTVTGPHRGVANFAEDIAIRHYAEQNDSIVHRSEFDRGGHFPATGAPDLFVKDVRSFFRPLR